MKKFALFFVGICGLTAMVSAQTITNTRLLNENAARIKITTLANYAKALALAKQKGWEIRTVTKKGRIVTLIGVDNGGFPMYYITDNNTTAAATTRANQLWPGGSSGLGLSGSSANMKNKLGIWDGGSLLGTHIELAGRVTQKDNAAVDDHATHVAGTMMATGVNPSAKGMAFGLQGIIAYNFDFDDVEMNTEAAAGLLLSNHSYSNIAGWYSNDAQSRWEFRGRPNETEDYKFGYYSAKAASYDDISYNAPNYLIVKSAGNVRLYNGPPVGSPYFRFDANGNMTAAGTRPAGISSNDTYDVISSDVTAKNILSIGAVNGLLNGYSRKEDVVMTDFSAWGPTDDGRIKPDLVADGVDVLSSVATANNAYASFSGTSMSAPNTTGSLLLLQEYYSKLKAGAFMRSASLKGLALHTADEAGAYDGPDYQFGWGLLNVEKAAAILTSAVGSNNALTSSGRLYENTLAQGASFTTTVVASGKGKLQATISWTDPAGTVIDETSAAALNNHAKKLVNDLDIKITKGARTYFPWVLDPAIPANPATHGDNITDNVERVDVDTTVPGQTYTVTVTHKGTLVKAPQAYSLIISGVGGSSYCTSASGGVDGARIDSVSFNTLHQLSPAAARAYTNYADNITNIEPLQTIPLFVRIGNTGATTNSKIIKVFIDYNNNGLFDASELVLTSSVLAAGTTTYSGNILTPSSLTLGNILLMRIVLQETTDASAVVACGTYGKGETQDYSLRVVPPANDLSITNIVTPQTFDCGTDSVYATIALRNSGTVAQSNVPVALTIATSAGVVASLTGIYPGTIPALTTFNYTFQKPVTLASATNYTFTATVSQPSDQLSSNNQAVSFISTTAKAAAVVATGTFCNTTATLSVNNPNTSSDYFWYTSPTTTQPFAVGPTVTTTTLPANNTYYVAAGARGSIGLPNKLVYPSGGYNHFNGNFMRFNNTVPIVLESVRLYVGNPGKIKVSVGTITSENAATGSYNYNELSYTILDVYATKANPGPNPTAATTVENPVTDTGAVFHLGLPVFPTGDHFINIKLLYPDGTEIPTTVSSTGASFFRNGDITGTTTYPVGINNVANFTGNSATGTGVTQSQFYYIFYDLKVSTADCVSDRATVVATATPTPVISQSGKQLVSSITTGIQWFLGATAVAGATSSPFTPTQSGSYTVTSTANGCVKTSTPFSYVITAIDPVVAAREINLTVSPNPNNGVFNLSFEVTDKADLSIEILNAAGQRVYNQSQKNFVGKYSKQIHVEVHAAEVYMLKINHNKKNYVYKIITEHK
jgi:hypothetical protein